MKSFEILTSRFIPLPMNNIDTDQIIPARYLKVTDKASVAQGLFFDWRYEADGSPNPDFVMNQPMYAGAQILLAGNNFGCGSSREHAPWALAGNGIRAVISTSFADIFNNNARKNGLLTVEVDPQTHQTLLEFSAELPESELTIDLPGQTLTMPNGEKAAFEIDVFSKKCLLAGIDQFGYLHSFEDAIKSYEAAHAK